MAKSQPVFLSRQELIAMLNEVTDDLLALRGLWQEQVDINVREHEEIGRLNAKLDKYLARIVALTEQNNELVTRLEALERPVPEFGVQVHEDRRVRAD